MQGTIVLINDQRGMYCIELSNGLYTVFELLDSNDIQIGDIVSGDLEELGGCTLQNLTDGVYFEAFIESVDADLSAARNHTSLF